MTPSEAAARQLNLIKATAIERWGDRWLAEIVKTYSHITNANPQTRYRTVQRMFENGDCRLSTLNALLEAIDCKLKLLPINIEEKDF